MNTHYIDPHEFRDIKRYELLDRIDQGWTVRLKSTKFEWNKAGSLHTANISLKNLLEGGWEGRPPIPKLLKNKGGFFLETVIVLAKQHQKAYIHNEDWPDDKFIKWDTEKRRFVHVFHYPEIDYNTEVSFSGNYFNTATFEIWSEG